MNKPTEDARVGASVGGLRLPLLRPMQEEIHVWVDAEKGRRADEQLEFSASAHLLVLCIMGTQLAPAILNDRL